MTTEQSLFKSYNIIHKANPAKLSSLFQLYSVYSTQYKKLIHSHWLNFIHHRYHLISTFYYTYNKAKFTIPSFYKPFTFTHLGSTKHIDTQLNASYLQCCLQQVSSSLNKHLTSVEQLFNQFINKSSVNNENKDFLHQLRSINKNRAWLNNNTIYYPTTQYDIIDDFVTFK